MVFCHASKLAYYIITTTNHQSIIKALATDAINHIVQTYGGVKLWQTDCFRVFMGKMLVNDIHFAKFAKVFPRQNFALYDDHGNQRISKYSAMNMHQCSW